MLIIHKFPQRESENLYFFNALHADKYRTDTRPTAPSRREEKLEEKYLNN